MLTPRTKKKSIVIVATSFSCLIERRIPGRRGVTLIPPAVMNPNWDITQGRAPDLFSHYGSSTVASRRKEWKRQPEKYSTSCWKKNPITFCTAAVQKFVAALFCHVLPFVPSVTPSSITSASTQSPRHPLTASQSSGFLLLLSPSQDADGHARS